MGDLVGFEFLTDVACSGKELLEAAGEGIHAFVFLRRWQERMLPSDLFDGGEDMGQTGLPVSADIVIGGVAITDEGAREVFSEDSLGHIGGAVAVDVKEGDVLIAPEPDDVADSVVSP